MAPRRNTKIVKNNVNLNYKSLKQGDVLCPICRSILIEPVTLPCNHNFCSLCFKWESAIVCPSCKVRISSWLRSVTKSKKLINERLWKAIQHDFGPQVKNRLSKIKRKWGDRTEKGQNLEKQFNNGGEFQLAEKQPMSVTNNKVSNNFFDKEYTCRILCQSSELEAKQTNVDNIQMKNKQIQKIITQDEISDRSYSKIESELMCFRPINYRYNPPSVGLQPIKVPSKKAPFNSNVKITAPSGCNKIEYGEPSAFVRLYKELKRERTPSPKQSLKKKSKKQTKKHKSKITTKSPPFKGFDNKDSSTTTTEAAVKAPSPKDSPPFKGFPHQPGSPPLRDFLEKSQNQENHKIATKSPSGDEEKKKQEQSDFQLALKLQDAYDSFGKPTRSRCLRKLSTTTTTTIGVK